MFGRQAMLGYGFEEDGPPDRRSWAEKSPAAAARELEAMKLFNSFHQASKALPESQFPLTREVIPATVHLTGPCWTSFRKYVTSIGCKVKRREATMAERQGDNRKGKMYVISITIPVHPSKIIEYTTDKKEKAAVAAAQRKARDEVRAKEQVTLEKQQAAQAQQQAAQKVTEEEEKWDKLQKEYNVILSQSVAMSSALPAVAASVASPTTTPTPPPKRHRYTWSSPDVSSHDMLKHADEVYQHRTKEIARMVAQEKRQMEAALNAKKRQLESQASQECSLVKEAVMDSMPSTQTCDLCHNKHRILAAKCIGEECAIQLCMECLKAKVEDRFKCVVCKELSGRTAQRKYHSHEMEEFMKHYAPSKKPTPTKTAAENFMCDACVKKQANYYQFEYCRNDCGFICPEHTHEENCCVCGYTAFCSECTIDTCSRCGKNLCQRCEIKEGCMCVEEGRYGRGYW